MQMNVLKKGGRIGRKQDCVFSQAVINHVGARVKKAEQLA